MLDQHAMATFEREFQVAGEIMFQLTGNILTPE